jgi:(2Fe-2S) ferredoxin
MAVKDLISVKKCLFICNGGSCMKVDAENVTQAIRKSIKELNLDDQYHTVRTKCIGRCDDAPVMMIAPENVWLQNIKTEQCKKIVSEIDAGKTKDSNHFLYQFGENTIASDSIPTKKRKNQFNNK